LESVKRKLSFRNLKLSHRLYLLISFSICIIMVFNGIFYSRLSRTIYEQVRLYAEDTVNQIEFNIRSVINTIKTSGKDISYNLFLHDYLTVDNSYRKVELSDYITDLFYTTFNSEYISAAVLVDSEGRLFMFKQIPETTRHIYKLESKYDFLSENFRNSFFTIFTDVDILREEKDYLAYLIPIFYSGDLPRYKGRIGTLIIICDIKRFAYPIERLSLSNTTVILKDSNDKVLFSNSVDNEGMDSGNNSEYFHTTRYIDDINCKIECFVPLIVKNDMSFFKNSFLITAAITILLLIMIGVVINIGITSPVVKIVDAIKKVGERNLKERIELKLDGDMGFITQNINIMLDRIEQLAKRVFDTQDKLYQVEILKKQAELSALQNQINPHFLYNTLECVRSIGISYDVEEVVEISGAMADIFRYSIKSDEIVAIRDEVDIIKRYFRIISIRFMGRISMQDSIDREILDFKIPKMILQPIVENAVYHGLERKDGSGNLYIMGGVVQDKVVFAIQDDGVGIKKEEVDEINRIINEQIETNSLNRSNRSIGLANINARIKILFGDDYGLKIDSELNKGTQVTVTFPKIVSAYNIKTKSSSMS